MVKALKIFLLIACFIGVAHAMEYEKGTIKSSIITKNPHQYLTGALPIKKDVYLMKVKVTPKERHYLLNFKPSSRAYLSALSQRAGVPPHIDRGMNNVPVLDQGMHGSCVTFANTAAIDALLGKGDYISQLCNLELGSYLEINGFLPSGWSGTGNEYVLHQMLAFGVISKDNQKAKSCAGRTDYPLHNPSDIGNPMSLESYKLMSESLSNIEFDPVLTAFQRMAWISGHDIDVPDTQSEEALLKIKEALADPELGPTTRITFGGFIFPDQCSAGACASYHEKYDTWAFTKEIISGGEHVAIGGHAMVITGYDDNAVAIDNEGKKHQGLLILRNSWGEEAGDRGTYYMSYDYFKKLVIEAYKVVGVPESKV